MTSKAREKLSTVFATLLPLLLLSGVAWAQKVHPKVEDELKALPPGGKLSVIVVLSDRTDLNAVLQKAGKKRSDRRRAVIEALKKKAAATQPPILALLTRWKTEGRVDRFHPFWIINGFEVTGTASVIRQLAAMREVLTIEPNLVVSVPPLAPAAAEAPAATSEWNIAKIRAPEVWALGFQGQGTVVGGIDTGVLLTHPDLESRWRGGSNSWLDVINGRDTPYDDNGHGTHTIGTAVGGSAGGTNIGVAPGAAWIACKFLRSSGSGTFFGAFLCMQWMLDPDDNPATDDAPDVVNNSWGTSPGCFLVVDDVVRAWRAAGIVPVFAAGNSGPGAETGGTPAVYPESFAVGATDVNDVIVDFSSRGPSSCDNTIFPEVSAPGRRVKSAYNNGGYAIASGTSMAAPHVAGAVALLRNADPSLTVDQIESLLKSKAVDLGETGPDNAYGFGRIDAFAAVATIAPVIKVTPTEPTDFGTVAIGSFAERTFTVENIGGGTLNGTATTVAPFSSASGGSYRLTAGQGAQVIARFTPIAPGVVTGTVTFTGGGDTTRQVTGTGIRVNRSPTTDAGGPYTVEEGGMVTLNGTGADPDDDPLTFAWDLDNDGTFETPGQSVTFSAVGLDGPSSRTLVLKATDPNGLSATSEAMVTIHNVAPTVTALSATPLMPTEGSPVTFSGTFTDPGTPDTHTVAWDFGDSTGLSFPLVPTGTRTVAQDHTYANNGMFTVRLTITDDDGGSRMKELQVQVQNIRPVFDPPLTNQMVDEGTLLRFMVRAVDPSGVDLLTLTATDLPPGASFTVPEGVHLGGIGGTFAWTPSCAQAGIYPVSFRATDDDGAFVEQTITVTVVEACQVFVYITNRDSDTVSILDSQTNTVGKSLPVGHKPKALTVLPDGSKVYVTNRNDDTVTVIQTGPTAANHRVLQTIWSVGQKPEGVAPMPDGEYVWVANRNDDTVSIIRRRDDTVIQTVRLNSHPPPSSSGKGRGDEKAGGKTTYEAEEPGGPEKPVAIGFAPDGKRAYVTARNSNDLLVLDTEKALLRPDEAIVATVPVGNKPVALAVSPSGKVIYVVNRSGNSVSVVDAATSAVLATIPVGGEPEGVTVTPEGAKVYGTSSAANEVWVLQVHSGAPFLQELRRIPVGQKPAGIATTPAETGLHRAYVANRVDHTVSVIDTTSDSVIATIPVEKGPVGVAAGLLRTP